MSELAKEQPKTLKEQYDEAVSDYYDAMDRAAEARARQVAIARQMGAISIYETSQ